MVQAQGVRPPDPYQTLQLDRSAPRSLIVEVYLALSRRAGRQGDHTWLQQLRGAYAIALSQANRRTDEPFDQRDHYAVLHVDPDADDEIISLAYALLPRIEPVPLRGVMRHKRDEAFRVLNNPKLRARYDEERGGATLLATPRHAAREIHLVPVSPRQERPAVETKKRGLFGRKARPDIEAAKDARLLSLRDVLSVEPDGERDPGSAEETALNAALPQAEVVFIAGPREGMRVEVNGNVIPFGDGKSAGTLWRQGERFLLRHTGKGVRVGGSAPSLAILVLEDGDEILIGSDRARFSILTSS
jgi:hypothetical protein